VADSGRQGAGIGLAIQALVLLPFEASWSGQWDKALQLCDDTLELCDTHGFPLFANSVRHVQAAVFAARGEEAAAKATVDSMVQWAVPRGVAHVHRVSARIRTLTAMGQGEFEEAFRAATAISPAGTPASHVQLANWVILDVVEAAKRSGRKAEAAAHLAAIREANIAAISSRMALLAGGAAAIAGPDERAVERFEEALAIPGADHWPFDLARVQLA